MHELLTGEELRDALVGRLGDEVAPGGGLDRSKVAERVFGDEEAREWLEELLGPKVGERVAAWKAEIDDSDPPPRAAVVEVPLLFEAGMDEAFDTTIAVGADEAVRADRAGSRGHAEVDSRAGRQLSQDEKAARADYVVRNDGTLEELREELSRVLETMGT